MPYISEEENALLQELLHNDTSTFRGKGKLKKLGLFIGRLMKLADDLTDAFDQKQRAIELMANGLWLTIKGKLTEKQIYANERLSEAQRDDLLGVLQIRYYAEAYCREHDIPLDGMSALSDAAPAPTTPEQPTVFTLPPATND